MRISIEGNMGVGKSTFLEILNSCSNEVDQWKLTPEPIKEWQVV